MTAIVYSAPSLAPLLFRILHASSHILHWTASCKLCQISHFAFSSVIYKLQFLWSPPNLGLISLALHRWSLKSISHCSLGIRVPQGGHHLLLPPLGPGIGGETQKGKDKHQHSIPWIEVLSEKSSVVFSKVAFPLIISLVPSPGGGGRCRIGMDWGWRKSLTIKAVAKKCFGNISVFTLLYCTVSTN